MSGPSQPEKKPLAASTPNLAGGEGAFKPAAGEEALNPAAVEEASKPTAPKPAAVEAAPKPTAPKSAAVEEAPKPAAGKPAPRPAAVGPASVEEAPKPAAAACEQAPKRAAAESFTLRDKLDLRISMLATVNQWILVADAKAAAMLTLAGAALALLGQQASAIRQLIWKLEPSKQYVCWSLLILGTVLLLVSILKAGATFFPRLGTKDPPHSPLYFGHIRLMLTDAFRQKLSTLDADSLLGEYESQIHINSIIATKKFQAVRVAVVVLILGVVLLGIVHFIIPAK